MSLLDQQVGFIRYTDSSCYKQGLFKSDKSKSINNRLVWRMALLPRDLFFGAFEQGCVGAGPWGARVPPLGGGREIQSRELRHTWLTRCARTGDRQTHTSLSSHTSPFILIKKTQEIGKKTCSSHKKFANEWLLRTSSETKGHYPATGHKMCIDEFVHGNPILGCPHMPNICVSRMLLPWACLALGLRLNQTTLKMTRQIFLKWLALICFLLATSLILIGDSSFSDFDS